MSARFEELAWRETPMGEISLRRRIEPTLGLPVFEVKLGEEYLMSSLFTVAEIELARLGLAALTTDQDGTAEDGTDQDGTDPNGTDPNGAGLDVVVGGLGLGYTARAVLDDARVGSLLVVEALAEVIDWHERELLPDTAGLARDPRARLVNGDFFAMTASGGGYDPQVPARRFHAVLVDIDHTPRHVLHPSHASFYTPDGLRRLARHLHPGGVFALWSDDPPDHDFEQVLAEVFDTVDAHVVDFANPLTRGVSSNTVYVAR